MTIMETVEPIPRREECLRLMAENGMLDNIKAHSLAVTGVALFLGRELRHRGHPIDLGLVEAAALLHDLAKTRCLRTGEDHSALGAEILKRLGFNRIAAIVAQHVTLSEDGSGTEITEAELVNYADKRVCHDRIVSMKERFRDLRERYGTSSKAFQRLDDLERKTADLEGRLFLLLSMDPEQVACDMKSSDLYEERPAPGDGPCPNREDLIVGEKA
jgi:uncharacterized protein